MEMMTRTPVYSFNFFLEHQLHRESEAQDGDPEIEIQLIVGGIETVITLIKEEKEESTTFNTIQFHFIYFCVAKGDNSNKCINMN